jgi:hypothetical protein
MAKQSKSTQESAKPKKPLVNWFNRTKTKSAVTDSIAPDGSVISYNKKTVTAPASVLGGGAMKKEVKDVRKYKEISFNTDESSSLLNSYKKSKEGQKDKSYYHAGVTKRYESPKDSTVSHYSYSKDDSKKFRKPTKLLKGVDKSVKDSSIFRVTEKHDSPKLDYRKDFDYSYVGGKKESNKKTLALPKSTAKNMKDSFDNMKSAPEYIVTKTKKSSSKY